MFRVRPRPGVPTGAMPGGAASSESAASGDAWTNGKNEGALLSTRAVVIIGIAVVIAVVVGLGAGLGAAIKAGTAGPSAAVVIGVIVGLGAGMMAGIGVAASLHSLVDRSD